MPLVRAAGGVSAEPFGPFRLGWLEQVEVINRSVAALRGAGEPDATL